MLNNYLFYFLLGLYSYHNKNLNLLYIILHIVQIINLLVYQVLILLVLIIYLLFRCLNIYYRYTHYIFELILFQVGLLKLYKMLEALIFLYNQYTQKLIDILFPCLVFEILLISIFLHLQIQFLPLLNDKKNLSYQYLHNPSLILLSFHPM